MAEEVGMTFMALTQAADRHRDAGERTRAVDDIRNAATLVSGCLGKLSASAAILAAFDKQWSGMGKSLQDLEGAFTGIADRIIQIRDTVRELDDLVGESFEQLRGGQ